MPLTTLPDGTGGDVGDGSGGGGSTDTAEKLLIDICQIFRKTEIDDGQGTFHEQWDVINSGCSCYLSVGKTFPHELHKSESITTNIQYTLLVPLSTDVLPADRVLKDLYMYEIMESDSGSTDSKVLTLYLMRINIDTTAEFS